MKTIGWVAGCIGGFGLILQAFAGSPSDGLVMHYAFDRDEGGLVTDDSGNGRTGTVNGATWVADGARGGAYRFDDKYQTITATDTGLPSGDAPRSIALWMKLDRDYSDEKVTWMISYGTAGFNLNDCVLGFDWRQDRDRVFFSPGGSCFLAARQLPAPGTWIHVAYTYGGDGAHHLYIDGTPSDGMSELSGPVNTLLSGLLLLGGHPESIGPDGGYLDDVRIYDRVLSAEEIAALAVPEPGLVLHYTFDTDEGGLVTDDSGNGRTGTVHGATWVADGARGGAYRFDDNSQVITATDAGLPSGDAPRSIALWMKIDRDYPDGCTGMFGYGTDNFNKQFSGIGFDWRLDRDRVYFSPGGTCFLTEQQVPIPGTWIHVVYTYGGNGDHHLYFNGRLSDGMSELGGSVATLLSGTLRMGGHPNGEGPDGGYVDDVRIYNRPLSAREVAELAGVEPPDEDPGPPSRDLVLHYTFDEDVGTTAVDSSGCGNNGSLAGASFGPDGIEGQAAIFDGANDYIRAPSSASLMPAEVTVAGWVRFDSLPAGVAALVFKRNPNNSNNEAYALQLNAAGGLRFVLANGTQTRLDSAGTISTGEWHHVAATFSQPVMSIYVDGALAGTANHNCALAHDATADLFLGAADHKYYPMGSFARGALDEVRIYGRALGPEEIAALAGVAPSATAGPIAHYTFDIDNGPVAMDDSGNGRTGAVNGATWVADGMLGGAYRFDNNSQVITATDAGLPRGDAPRSVALWMKIDRDYPNGCTGMFGYGTDNFNKQFTGIGFDWRLDRDRVYFTPGGTCFLTGQQVPAPGTWIHVAYTYGGNGNHHLYFNGVLSDGMSELWGPVNTLLSGTLRMGGHPNGEGPDGGYLDDVRIYNRPLSAREVAELASMGSGEEEPPATGGDLVLHYSFDADDGSAATDLSEYGNDGQFAGAGLASDGLGGQMATFDGIDDYLRVPSSASLMPTEVTIAGWVRIDSLPAEVAALVFKRNPDHANNEAYALQINQQGGLRFVLGNGGQTRLDSPAMVVGTWHHVAATFAQPAVRIYVDGALAGIANHNYALSHNAAADLLIGAADHREYPMGSFAHGALDEVKIFNRALSAAEIETLAGESEEEDPPVSGGNRILHYPFDADDGARAMDSSEYGNHGTVQGVQIIPSGAEGGAAGFDGQDDYVRVPWSDSLKADDLTIATWVKVETLPSGIQSLVFKRVPGIANGMDYALQLTPGGEVRWTLAKHWQTVLDTPPLTIGQWHHVVATFSKPDMRLYLDGLLVGTASHFDRLTKNAATDLLIGAADTPTGEVCSYAKCQLDDLRLYNVVLSESEIAELAGSAGNGDLVLRYTFDADGTETATDSSGYGNDGTFVGSQIVENGMIANGAAFDGVDDYIRVPSSGPLTPSEVTLSAWMRFDSLPGEVAELIFKRNMQIHNNEAYALQIQSSGSLRFVLGNGLQTRLDSAPMGVGEWHHVAATFAQPTMKIYIDGAVAGTASHDCPLAHNPGADLLIGASDHAALPMASFAHGLLDDVRIYKRALNDQEIAALVLQRIAEGVLDAQDADRDGISNFAERRAGTDPLNNTDQFAIQSVTLSDEGAGRVVLRWDSVPGLTYQILWASDLVAGLVPLGSGILATELECAYTNEAAAEFTAGFFVIQIQE